MSAAFNRAIATADNGMGSDTELDTNADNGLSELDHALADWARRHGADALVARAFALAHWAVTQGHSCLPLDAIPVALMPVAQQQKLAAALDASALIGTAGDSRPLIVDHDRLYLHRYYTHESRLAGRLRELMAAPPAPFDTRPLGPGYGLFAADPQGQEATNWQAVAAFVALRHRFCVISGGPGTGKTYTIVRLLRVLIETTRAAGKPSPRIALAAPTGKAAARMLDSVRHGLDEMATDPRFDAELLPHMPQSAVTLHRLLGLTGATTRPHFHADNPLPADVIIIDEASMVDLPMMAKLTAAVSDQARLILLGDRYQLAAVESGSVLAEICSHAGVNHFTRQQQQAAGKLLYGDQQPARDALNDHVVTLQTSRRFNADSTIGRLAAAVNAGSISRVHELLSTDHADLNYHRATHAQAMAQLMDAQAAHYAALIRITDPKQALAQLTRQCILTAIRNGPAGSRTINNGIIERLAQQHHFNTASTWYHGRPIMVTRNDYRAGLYNGDVGIALYNADHELRIWFDGDDGLRSYLPSALPAHDTVYAMTIHKSQGSEFDHVILVLPDYDVPLLTRELLYTGLTRARQQLTVHASPGTLDNTIRRRLARHSALAQRLLQGDNPPPS